jgi:hypothetical protein
VSPGSITATGVAAGSRYPERTVSAVDWTTCVLATKLTLTFCSGDRELVIGDYAPASEAPVMALPGADHGRVAAKLADAGRPDVR